MNILTVPPGRSSCLLPILLPVLLLSGCASLPADRGASQVHDLLAERDAAVFNRPLAWQADSAERERQLALLLAASADRPLSADAAVGIALLQHPDVRRQYAKLGLAEADWLTASRLSNPVLSFSLLESDAAGHGHKLGYGLVQNFTELLFLRDRGRVATLGRDHARLQVAATLQALAADVQARYFDWVGAVQLARMRDLRAQAAETSAVLAQRFLDAGNLDALGLAREQAAAEQARLEAEAAAVHAETARLALNAAMGLEPHANWLAEPALPLPTGEEPPLSDLIARGLRQRLDLQATELASSNAQQARTLARRLRWLPFVEVGVQGEREADGTRLLGPTVSLALPLAGASRAGALRADAALEHSQATEAALRNVARHEIAVAYARMLSARARVQRYRDGLIPQREAIVARMQERYNYMLSGQFELLLAKQQEYAAYEGYLAALGDYWRSRAALARATGGELPGATAATPASPQPDAASPSETKDAHAGHHAHHHHHGAHPETAAPDADAAAGPSAAPVLDPHAGHRDPAPPASQHEHGAH